MICGKRRWNFLKYLCGASPVVLWLGTCLPMQGTWVRSLVGELRSHIPWGNEACQPQLQNPHAAAKDRCVPQLRRDTAKCIYV